MNKLKLNKETISQMDRNEMASVNGGIDICIISCKNGSGKEKPCCDQTSIEIKIDLSIGRGDQHGS